ncbi:ABC transporter substrate-binding protein [Mangrovicella endophytica]|uniref:ABC transporter substrate-binding protein n=1 Tax=Mangrovicella endophytica TaxID=2066697 RepID=UPI001FE00D6D|nr:ABC transporter substrate-binding protein [Mangrovicella endophytica]
MLRRAFDRMPRRLAAAALVGCILTAPAAAFAQQPPASPGSAAPAPVPPAAGAKGGTIQIGYLRTYERTLALSALDIPPENIGIAGAELAIADNDTTGRFMGQAFKLDAKTLAPGEDAVAAAQALLQDGVRFIVTDLTAEDTLKVADAVRDQGATVLNAGATDDSLREENCRANVMHTAPTRSMLTDALAQYLIWKQWRNWVLISGEHPNDVLFAEALKRSATKFGGSIVEERIFKDTGGARATDSGQAQVQRQIPVFMQGLPDHDVVLVADESEVFGTYIPWHTWIPRPVAGTAGLRASSWHPASEQWGGAQMQSRFEKAAGRRMDAKDMQAWTAVRTVGEAATRTNSVDPQKINDYLRSPEFSIAAFKGQKLTFRDWNWQLRQPILLGEARSVVSDSPQEGFLHQVSELDTLGIDRPETKCVLAK